MELLLYLFVFIDTALLVYIMYKLIFYKKGIIKERMEAIKNLSDDDKNDEFKAPFLQRIIKPGYQRLIKAIANATPKAIKEKYDVLIITSGITQKINFNNLILIQFMSGIILAGLNYILMKYSNGDIIVWRLLLPGFLAFITPLIFIYNKAQKRKEKIRRALPDLLDLIYVSVEAGLGFDAALKKTAEKMKGPLSSEIIKTINEITRGKEREEAFKSLIYRTGVDDVASFITAVIQTEKLGSNITNMLRIQSDTMRQNRRQRAEQKAARLPIIMLFPLIFFMFPSLFVVILGPAVINIFTHFIGL